MHFVYTSLGAIGILIVHKYGSEIARLGYWLYTITCIACSGCGLFHWLSVGSLTLHILISWYIT